MSIIKNLVRIVILLTCGIMQVFGVLAEGLSKLLNQSGRYLSTLDDKLENKAKPKKKTARKNTYIR